MIDRQKLRLAAILFFADGVDLLFIVVQPKQHIVRYKVRVKIIQSLTVNHKWGFELKELFYQEALYLEAQQEAGVSHSLVSPVPQLFLYDLAEEITDELSFVYNSSSQSSTSCGIKCV